jgi:hypothetical protein
MRSMPVARRSVVLVAASALVALSGCGSDEAEATSSPFEALFGEPESPAESRAKQLEQEEIVAQCMREQGWEYTPVDWAAQFPDQPEVDDPTGDEFGRQYGYGIARNYELWEWPNLDEDGNYVDGGFEGGNVVNPNDEYVSSLAPTEMEEYQVALYGEQSIVVSTVPVEASGDEAVAEPYTPPPLEEQGCYGKAQAEVYGEQVWNDPDFSERFGALSEDLENDPRLEDAEIAWSDCMYEISEDYDFYGPNDMYQYVQNLFAEAKGQELVEVDLETGEIVGQPGVYPEGGYSAEEGAEYGIGYAGTAKRLTEEEIRAFQAREVEIWNDDRSCLDESGYRDLRKQLEQELVDTIREEFPDLVDAADADEDA